MTNDNFVTKEELQELLSNTVSKNEFGYELEQKLSKLEFVRTMDTLHNSINMGFEDTNSLLMKVVALLVSDKADIVKLKAELFNILENYFRNEVSKSSGYANDGLLDLGFNVNNNFNIFDSIKYLDERDRLTIELAIIIYDNFNLFRGLPLLTADEDTQKLKVDVCGMFHSNRSFGNREGYVDTPLDYKGMEFLLSRGSWITDSSVNLNVKSIVKEYGYKVVDRKYSRYNVDVMVILDYLYNNQSNLPQNEFLAPLLSCIVKEVKEVQLESDSSLRALERLLLDYLNGSTASDTKEPFIRHLGLFSDIKFKGMELTKITSSENSLTIILKDVGTITISNVGHESLDRKLTMTEYNGNSGKLKLLVMMLTLLSELKDKEVES